MRLLYPSLSKYANKLGRDRMESAGEPEPTKTLPGSAEKFAVLMQRAELGIDLFTRKDALRDAS